MLPSDQEIIITVIGSSAFFLFLCFVTIVAVISYQNRRRNSLLEISLLHSEYAKEILQSQIEIQNALMQQIGQELHDDIGQLLSVARINMNILEESMVAGESSQYLNEASDILDKSIANLRALTKSFDGDFVKEFGLEESLLNELDRIQRTGRFLTNFKISGDRYSLGYEKEIMIFRIAQESLNNVMKHAGATSISGLIYFGETEFILSIQDNGRGFEKRGDPDTPLSSSGSGVRNMSRRAELIGATLEIESEAGKGTNISLRLKSPRL